MPRRRHLALFILTLSLALVGHAQVTWTGPIQNGYGNPLSSGLVAFVQGGTTITTSPVTNGVMTTVATLAAGAYEIRVADNTGAGIYDFFGWVRTTGSQDLGAAWTSGYSGSGVGQPWFRCTAPAGNTAGATYVRRDISPGQINTYNCGLNNGISYWYLGATNPPPSWTWNYGPASGGNTGTPTHAPINSIQVSDGSGGHNSDAAFTIDPTTHTRTSTANDVFNAVSSIPRAVYDVMDTRAAFKGGLAAAIAGTSGFTPSQVVQATADYAECQDITGGSAGFTKGFIRLPQGINISLSGIKIWNGQSIGGDTNTSGPNLLNDGVNQITISHHIAGDTIVCNGTTYTPGNSGNTYIHNFGISGHGTPSTLTDIGILMNCQSCAVQNIRGVSNQFGGPGILLTGTSAFGRNLGGDGSQIQGCKTFTGGFQPVSGFTLGNGSCGSVQNNALDGGVSDVYVSDGQVNAANHAAGPCYPLCAAFVAAGNGTYNDHIFAQLSDIGALGGGFNNKIEMFRGDFFSMEGIKLQTGLIVHDVMIDSACTDKALRTNYLAGVATGCFPINSAASANVSQFSVFNNAGIFDQSYNQAWVHDGTTGGAGTSGLYSLFTYQGNPSNTTANDWFIAGEDNSPAAARVVYPAMPPIAIGSGTTINASGLTAVELYNNVVINSIIGGSAGQRLTIVGNGTIAQGSQIFNLNGQDTTLVCTSGDGRSCSTSLEYVATAGNLWVQLSGPPNQTPTHVNFAGNPAVTLPSLIDVYGNVQPRPAPAFSILASMQLHGPAAGAGNAVFEEVATFPDGSYIVSDRQTTTVNLATQTAGSIFKFNTPQAVVSLYLVSNTEGNGVAIGKYPAGVLGWDGPTTIAAGGDGSTAPPANQTNTGQIWAPAVLITGTKFTTSGCAISSTTGGATGGSFTLGANSCTAVLTFNGATGTAAANGWTCQAHDRTAPTVLIGGESSSTLTTASFTIPAGAGATDVIGFQCVAY